MDVGVELRTGGAPPPGPLAWPEGRVALLYVGDEAEKQALVLGEPDLFFTTPSYDGSPLVMVRLERVGVARLDELVTDAWRMRAPADLLDD